MSFRIISSGLVAAIVVAALGLFTNMVETDRIPLFIGSVVAFVLAAGAVAYVLNLTSASHAQSLLDKTFSQCEDTLRHVRNEYTQSVLRGSIIHDSELDTLERSIETKEIWVVTPLNLDHDVPGKVFFETLKENIDTHKKSYLYVIKDSEQARYNAKAISERLINQDLLKFALLDQEEWNSLPIAGIPVTIHNPKSVNQLRIYISTQQHKERGQHWAYFSGWTTAQIIERTRDIVSKAKVVRTLGEYASG